MLATLLRHSTPTTVSIAGPLVQLRGLRKEYSSPAGTHVALNTADLAIERGELVAIVGRSGSGKTTLINLLAGIDRPSSGEVLVGGVAVHTLNEDAAAAWRGRTIGLIFQFFQLLPTLTAIENVMLPMELGGRLLPRERRSRAAALLARVGLADYADRLPAHLSGGQQQRVAIARALANEPALIIADEPTGNLDSSGAAAVFDLFAELAQQGAAVLLVTHDAALAARADRRLEMRDGTLTPLGV